MASSSQSVDLVAFTAHVFYLELPDVSMACPCTATFSFLVILGVSINPKTYVQRNTLNLLHCTGTQKMYVERNTLNLLHYTGTPYDRTNTFFSKMYVQRNTINLLHYTGIPFDRNNTDFSPQNYLSSQLANMELRFPTLHKHSVRHRHTMIHWHKLVY